MKVTIHIQPSGSLGGAETVAANLAALLGEHDVEIVHHRRWLTLDEFAGFAGVRLPNARLRYAEYHSNYLLSRSPHLWTMYREPRNWGRELVGAADVFITLTHELPPFNPAPRGVLLLLFPTSTPLVGWPFKPDRSGLRNRLSGLFYRSQYAALWRGYQTRLAISSYTALWAKRRWDIECAVLPPFVDCETAPDAKEDRVLTLGRFSVQGVSKEQFRMAAAFSAAADQLKGWRLTCVGAASTPDEIAYAERTRAVGPNIDTIVNASRGDVRIALARARVFWHAAGLGVDENEHPERFEHFGIATVEAMANGCVPVVFRGGGQPEIVEHGRSGFLADSFEAMVRRTTELAGDPHLWASMSAAARARAQHFGPLAFGNAVAETLPFLVKKRDPA